MEFKVNVEQFKTNFPRGLMEHKAWVGMKCKFDGYNWTKPPVNQQGYPCNLNDPKNYLTFGTVESMVNRNVADTFMYILKPNNYFVLNFPNSVEHRQIVNTYADNFASWCASYTELNETSDGFRILLKCSEPVNGHTYTHHNFQLITTWCGFTGIQFYQDINGISEISLEEYEKLHKALSSSQREVPGWFMYPRDHPRFKR